MGLNRKITATEVKDYREVGREDYPRVGFVNGETGGFRAGLAGHNAILPGIRGAKFKIDPGRKRGIFVMIPFLYKKDGDPEEWFQ